MKSVVFKEYPIGKIGIAEEMGKITQVTLKEDDLIGEVEIAETPLLCEAHQQLSEYFRGERKAFTLPLNPQGTPFMRTVWDKLCAIPYGKTASYKEIAEQISSPKAVRAVGLANNRNPIPLFIPCHRVIGSDGKLVGYRGGLDMKEALLKLEESHV